MSAAAEFRDAIAASGLTPPNEIIGDGERHRFSSDGRPSNKSGWYRFHDDERPAGAFGCWRTDMSVTWKSSKPQQFTEAEREQYRERMQRLEKQRAREREEATDYAAVTAAQMWNEAVVADHPYLERKQITCLGARVLGDMLLVPMKHSAKELVGLQRIWPDGTKRFIKGSPLAGAYCTIGTPTKDGTVVICEGYATGVSIHLATNYCVVVAFNSGNLAEVSQKIRRALPSARMIIAGDDDAFTVRPPNHAQAGQPWNPGIEAASATGFPVYLPVWYGGRDTGTDFNDLHVAEGLKAVRACFKSPATLSPPGSVSDKPTVKPVSDGGDRAPDNTGSLGGVPPFASDQAVHDEPARPVILPGGGSDDTEDLMIFSSTPMKTAELFHATLPEGGRILHWRGEFYSWDGTRYVIRDRVYIDQRLYHFMAKCVTIKENKHGDREIVAFNPKTSSVNDVAHALRAVCYADLPEPQCWIDQRPDDPPAGEIIAFANGFLHWPTRTLFPSSDRLFVTSALDFAYTPGAGQPTNWIKFLQGLWPQDDESITALSDMFGYLLTDDTSQQKMFMLIGPPRSGKGTILRVLESLVGYSNRVSPSLASIGTQFGLQPLIGKRLAMISDARLSGRADQQPIVENLLRISGEDALSIDRKNISAWTGKLPTRFVLASNELPAFSDASAALANRFMMFKFTESFLGREDHGLTTRLLQELPAIVLWALDGLKRLQERGYLIRPKSSEDLAEDLIEQTSPMRSFVADKCVVGAVYQCNRDELFKAWKAWCEDQGRDHPGTKVSFGRQLSAAFSGVKRSQPRDSGTRLNLYSGIRLRHDWETFGQEDDGPL
jgi:putative DNA primase/helicase